MIAFAAHDDFPLIGAHMNCLRFSQSIFTLALVSRMLVHTNEYVAFSTEVARASQSQKFDDVSRDCGSPSLTEFSERDLAFQ